MENLSELFFLISLFAYFFATVFYIIYAIFKRDIIGKLATWILAGGIIVQTVALILRTKETGHFPFVTIYETLVFWSWLIAISYLILQFWLRIKVLGAIITPLAFFSIAFASALAPNYKGTSPLVPALQSHWLEFHISTSFISYACFAISFAVGLAYLIKRSNNPESLLSKDKLDMIGYKSISVGFPFLTIGIISGSIWANIAWGSYWSWDPKETWALITWIIYAIYLHLRIFAKWKGKSSAIASIIGFACVIFTFLGVNFLLSGLHSYL
ncbi:TPA: c-type cytochrome biogenesis protein CcsB [bacterium]|nr:c-type cytochrome biogenesis protein CcsB [bacterium]